MRIDKFLKNSRIIKRRTVAKEACEAGRVFINDKKAKAGDEVSIGDTIQVNFGSGSLKVEVLKLEDNPRKDAAKDMYKTLG